MSDDPEQLSFGLDDAPAPVATAVARSTSTTGTVKFTPQQREAIECRDPYVFSEAGAGCGKTGVLVQRYCDAIEEDHGRGVDAVLAFTFTEKAAAELRARIRAELRRRSREAFEGGDGDRARELTAYSRAPGSWVTTIHGFCRRLISAHPIAAGVDPGFIVLEQSQATELADRAFDLAFEEYLADPTTARLERATQWRPNLRDGIRYAYEELRSLGKNPPQLPDPPPPGLRESLVSLGPIAQAALAATEDARGGSVASYREQMSTALGFAAAAPAAGSDDDPALPGTDELERLRVESSAKAFSVPEVEQYNEAVTQALSRSEIPAYDAFRDLLNTYGSVYSRLKQERAGLDFEDLQLRAVDLLDSHPAIAAIYHERFAHILVDEYQDTNTLQTKLIDLLRGPSTRLFTVGDEFQSIYGFRNADISIFRAERSKAKALRMNGNFRSVPEIIAAVNSLGGATLGGFSPLEAATDPGNAPGSDAAALPDGQPAVELNLLPKDGWDQPEVGLDEVGKIDGRPERVAEAASLANRLAELVTAGVPRSEIVILMRAFTHVAPYEEALARAGLQPLVIGGRGYWSQQQVEDMRAILGAIDNPLDDLRLLGALASPAGAVSPDTLWLLRKAAGKRNHIWPLLRRRFGGDEDGEPAEGEDTEALNAIVEADLERLRRFTPAIEALRAEAGLRPLDQTIDRVARALGYDLVALMRDRGERRWANVRKLMNMARTYEQGEGRSLRGFLASIDTRIEREEAEPEAATRSEGHDGVRIMTIHNAKGLEFGVVVLANAGRRLDEGSSSPTLRVGSDPGADELRAGLSLARTGTSSLKLFAYQELADQAKVAECAEELRLAYVAATRAQRRLIISGTFPTTSKGQGEIKENTSVLERMIDLAGIEISRAEAKDPASAFVAWPGAGHERIDAGPVSARVGAEGHDFELAVRVALPEPERGSEMLADLLQHGRAAESPVARFDPKSIGPMALGDRTDAIAAAGQLSASSLEQFARCGYRFYAERRLGLKLPEAEAPGVGDGFDPLRFGSAVHGLLEWSGRNRWATPPAERARELLGDDDQAARANAMVAAWLESELAVELRDANAMLTPEAPFIHGARGAILRGNIDLLAEREGMAPLVIDYKTNAMRGRSADQMMAGYEIQRDLYAVAIGEDHDAAGAVETAFVFLEDAANPARRLYGVEELTAARDRIGERIAAVAEERFEVTDQPNRFTCKGCPVEGTLCPHPPEKTRSDPPG